jgi:MFS transporter, DHA2 family, methylenomycin A resistance protein
VVAGYTLTFSAQLLFTASTLPDRIGAKRAYGLGIAVFVVARPRVAWRPRWAFSSRHA